MTTEQLKEYKNIYKDITVPQHVIEAKWLRQIEVLPEQEKKPVYHRYISYSAAFLSLCFVLFVGTFAFAQSTQPGNVLYPLKAVTKKITTMISKTITPENNPITPLKTHKTIQHHSAVTASVPTPTTIPAPTGKTAVKGISSENTQSDHASNSKNTDIEVPIRAATPSQQSTDHGNSESGSNTNNANNDHGNNDNKGGISDNPHGDSNINNSSNNGKK